MKALLVASECTPFAKVGGLGDVIGALPPALLAEGVESAVILPLYKPLLASELELVSLHGSRSFSIPFKGTDYVCELYKTFFHNSTVPLYLIKNMELLSNGGIYLSEDAMAVGNDEPERFMFFCKAVAFLLKQQIIDYSIVHCNDWHTSFLLKLINDDVSLKSRIRTILSVHNLGNVGLVTDAVLNSEIDGTSKDHQLMAVGVENADCVVPVSQNYAQELLRGEFCFGLESIVQSNKSKFHGITNGIDTDYFNPRKDPFLGRTYSVDNWEEGKLHAKEELFKKEKWDYLPASDSFLFGFVGRVAEQKNIDLIVKTIEKMHAPELHFVFLGVGEVGLTQELHSLALKHNNRVKFINRFDEAYARLIYAGSDSFLVPSLYEPCGLTQMIAMRYGSLPIGRMVGGLVDTIDDREGSQSGFLFEKSTVEELEDVLLYVYDEWKNNHEEWKQLVKNAMNKNFSWRNAAREYIKLYNNR